MWRTIVPALLAVPMICAFAAPVPAAAVVADDGERCEGSMELGGKTYALKHAVAYPVKVFDDDGCAVIFAEQAIPVAKLRTALAEGKGSDDKFFFFKPHVRVTFDKAGKLMFCNAYADNNSLSVSGPKLVGELSVKDGKARGKASLASEADAKRKSAFDVAAFELTLLDVPAPKAAAAEPEETESDDAKPADSSEGAAKPAAVHHKDLPLPEGAAEVQYQKVGGQIRFKVPGTVEKAAAALTDALAKQGWETQGTDLVAKSATLRRKRGDASLTIFVRAADADTVGVQILSTGLAGDEKK